MEVIAKTNGAFLIEATEKEIKEIVNAVTGSRPDSIKIGQKIPAIDYASTITKVKSLKDDLFFTSLISYAERMKKTVDDFQKVVEQASNINI